MGIRLPGYQKHNQNNCTIKKIKQTIPGYQATSYQTIKKLKSKHSQAPKLATWLPGYLTIYKNQEI